MTDLDDTIWALLPSQDTVYLEQLLWRWVCVVHRAWWTHTFFSDGKLRWYLFRCGVPSWLQWALVISTLPSYTPPEGSWCCRASFTPLQQVAVENSSRAFLKPVRASGASALWLHYLQGHQNSCFVFVPRMKGTEGSLYQLGTEVAFMWLMNKGCIGLQ